MQQTRISFIATVYNEEKTILDFLKSIFKQTKKPDEIIIVDGGSTDATASVISNFKFQISNKRTSNKPRINLIIKKGNRAVGRNEAIKNSTRDTIVCSDAGCLLDKDWIKNIVEPFNDITVDVVAGYYRGLYRNVFQKSLIPYVLVMPDNINSKKFLPSSRSMAFKKNIWLRAGKFPEKYSYNEDYIFAKNLEKIGAKIVFEKIAIVEWIPRENLKEAFRMFYKFAFGDAESGIFRAKVFLLLLRYFFAVTLLLLFILNKFNYLVYIVILFVLYLLWAVVKNYRYVKDIKAFVFLPVIQLTADMAVLSGTFFGAVKNIFGKLISYFLKNKIISIIVLIYSLLMISVINWGIPNFDHPFTYHMDEWHFFQAVRSVFKDGTTTKAGVAVTPFFHPVTAGIFISPFVAFQMINIGSIRGSLDNLETQRVVFELLRLHTLVFGVLSIFVLGKIAKLLKINIFLTIFLFTFTPIWLSLSNYFKYDIALCFWILVSLFCMLRLKENNSERRHLLVGISIGFALATKFTALPLLVVYIIAFFLFEKNYRKQINKFLLSVTSCTLIFLIAGVPHLFIGKADYWEHFTSVVLQSPQDSFNYILSINYWLYLWIKQYLTIFGHPLYLLSVSSIIYLILRLWYRYKNKSDYKIELFLLVSLFILIMTLVPLKLSATGNRSLVLLPVLAIISSFFLTKILSVFNKYKILLLIIIAFLFSVQMLESLSWVDMKWGNDPREASSIWIKNNIEKKTLIGIENIPIYQMVPNNILKEYYSKSSNLNEYKYEIINQNSKQLPGIIIISNADFYSKYLRLSPKKDLLDRLEEENYKNVVNFYPNWRINQIFTNRMDFVISSLIPIPIISIFKKT